MNSARVLLEISRGIIEFYSMARFSLQRGLFVRFSEVWEIDYVDKFEDVFMGSSYRGPMFNIFQPVYFVLSNSVF